MNVQLVELTVEEVIGLNQKAIEERVRRDPSSTAEHAVRSRGGLEGCLGGVFIQLGEGYMLLPLEEIAELVWGFASPADDPSLPPKYSEGDAVRFVFDNIAPVI